MRNLTSERVYLPPRYLPPLYLPPPYLPPSLSPPNPRAPAGVTPSHARHHPPRRGRLRRRSLPAPEWSALAAATAATPRRARRGHDPGVAERRDVPGRRAVPHYFRVQSQP